MILCHDRKTLIFIRVLTDSPNLEFFISNIYVYIYIFLRTNIKYYLIKYAILISYSINKKASEIYLIPNTKYFKEKFVSSYLLTSVCHNVRVPAYLLDIFYTLHNAMPWVQLHN